MNNWYTADSHFGNDSISILKRDNRLFKDNAEYTAEQVRIWNEQAAPEDTIYAIGDFCNYNDREKDYVSGFVLPMRRAEALRKLPPPAFCVLPRSDVHHLLRLQLHNRKPREI